MICRPWAGSQAVVSGLLIATGFSAALAFDGFSLAALAGYLLLARVCHCASPVVSGVLGCFAGACVAVVIYVAVVNASWLLCLFLIITLAVSFALIASASSVLIRLYPGSAFIWVIWPMLIVEALLGFLGYPFSFNTFFVDSPLMALLLPLIGAEWQIGLYWGGAVLLARSPMLILSGLLVAGVWFAVSVNQPDSGSTRTDITVAVMQTDMSGEMIDFPGLQGNLEARTASITTIARQLEQPVDLVVFPESVLPVLTEEIPPFWYEFFQSVPAASLLFHRYRAADSGGRISENVLLDSERRIIGISRKAAPVPLVESNIIASGYRALMFIREVPFLSMICSDSLLAYHYRNLSETAGFIVLTANDRSLRGGLLPRLHQKIDQIRTAETGVPLIRAVNGGPGSFIRSDGSVQAVMAEDESGVLVSRVPTVNRSFFIRYYQSILLLTAVLLILSVVFMGACFRRNPAVSSGLLIQGRGGWLVIFFVALGTVIFGRYPPESMTEARTIMPGDRFRINYRTFLLRQFGISQDHSIELFERFFVMVKTDISTPEGIPSGCAAAVINTIEGSWLLLDYSAENYLIFNGKGLLIVPGNELYQKTIGDVALIAEKNNVRYCKY